MTIETGTTLGRYEIRTKLGAVGMGEMYQGRDTPIGAHDGTTYVLSELLEGETLRKRIAETPLAQRRALLITHYRSTASQQRTRRESFMVISSLRTSSSLTMVE
jgi:hypothetical protein